MAHSHQHAVCYSVKNKDTNYNEMVKWQVAWKNLVSSFFLSIETQDLFGQSYLLCHSGNKTIEGNRVKEDLQEKKVIVVLLLV
jgi:hypothetical protein